MRHHARVRVLDRRASKGTPRSNATWPVMSNEIGNAIAMDGPMSPGWIDIATRQCRFHNQRNGSPAITSTAPHASAFAPVPISAYTL